MQVCDFMGGVCLRAGSGWRRARSGARAPFGARGSYVHTPRQQPQLLLSYVKEPPSGLSG